jgi:signal peptidase I
MNATGSATAESPTWVRLVIGRHPRWTLARLGVLILTSAVLFKFIFVPIRVTGRSMEPTYADGRVNFVNQISYRTRPPQRGDVVGIRLEGTRMVVLKRIVGLPGERVALRRGMIFIDGRKLEEAYTRKVNSTLSSREIRLGAEEYFAIGDNRLSSAFDVVRRQEIKGKVLF